MNGQAKIRKISLAKKSKTILKILEERFNSAVEVVAYDGETALRLSDVVLNRTGFVALEVAFHRDSDD